MTKLALAVEPALDGGDNDDADLVLLDDGDNAMYEAQRRANILANAALLESLGLKSTHTATLNAKERPAKEVVFKVVKPHRKVVMPPREEVPKRLAALNGIKAWQSAMSRSSSRSYPPVKRERERADDFVDSGYSSDELDDEADYRPPRASKAYRSTSSYAGRPKRMSSLDLIDERQRQAQRLGERTQDPKTFGHIPGIPVGTIWASRMDCSTDAVHAPTVAGISGNGESGCWSIALSGGYEDDIDEGNRFTFTGSGGRKLKGMSNGKNLNLRTAPQSFDQSFDHPMNAALVTSCRSHRPIRVIRGYKGQTVWNPPEGYVYSGLYICSRYWRDRGQSGFLVCRFEFTRIKGQPLLPRFDVQKAAMDDEAGMPLSPATPTSKGIGKLYSLCTPRSRSQSIVEVLIERHPSHSPKKTVF